MYGGDEVSAIVVDVGSDTTKVGYAGEDCPKMVFSSALGCLSADDGSKKWSVDELNFPTPELEVSSAFTDGLISNWEGYEQVRRYRSLSRSLTSHSRTRRGGLCSDLDARASHASADRDCGAPADGC